MRELQTFSGKVVAGERIGRTLGFPTANIDVDAAALGLERGVYAAAVRMEGRPETYRAMLNIGHRPTFAGKVCTIEAHLLDFSGDLYGKTLHVTLKRKLREERRFTDVAALKKQLAEDAAQAARD
ncbi:MAG: riboflavin kinase [Bacteroidales bacterium]|nr:riboflavin kinase [Bacteroidales bacterium]